MRGAEAAPDAPNSTAVPDSPLCRVTKPSLRPPANDTSSSNSQVSTRLANVSATDTPAWLWPTTTTATGNVLVYSRIRAITTSPSTSASVRNAEPSTALRIAGSTTRSSASGRLAPRLRAASTSVRSGTAARPLSIAR